MSKTEIHSKMTSRGNLLIQTIENDEFHSLHDARSALIRKQVVSILSLGLEFGLGAGITIAGLVTTLDSVISGKIEEMGVASIDFTIAGTLFYGAAKTFQNGRLISRQLRELNKGIV